MLRRPCPQRITSGDCEIISYTSVWLFSQTPHSSQIGIEPSGLFCQGVGPNRCADFSYRRVPQIAVNSPLTGEYSGPKKARKKFSENRVFRPSESRNSNIISRFPVLLGCETRFTSFPPSRLFVIVSISQWGSGTNGFVPGHEVGRCAFTSSVSRSA